MLSWINLSTPGGYFDYQGDEWFERRSYLNHTELGNKLHKRLQPDWEPYAETVIKAGKHDFTDPRLLDDYKRTKEDIETWSDTKQQMLAHARDIFETFNPFSQGLNLLSLALPAEDINWLSNELRTEARTRLNLDKWVADVEMAISSIEDAFNNIRHNKGTIAALRTEVDELIRIYSGSGYYVFAKNE